MITTVFLSLCASRSKLSCATHGLRCTWLAAVLAALLIGLAACAPAGPAIKVVGSDQEAKQILEKTGQSKAEKVLKEQKHKQDARVYKALQQASVMDARSYVHQYATHLAQRGEYTLGPEDVISVQVFGEPSLSRDSITVSEDGLINFPLIGRVQVGGMTTTQAEKCIGRELINENYLLDPHVSVQVVTYLSKEVLVLGALKNPGQYQLKASESILDIISRAGGVEMSKGGHELTLIRTENTPEKGRHKVAVKIDLDQLLDSPSQHADMILKDKDVVYIPESQKFTVMGEVKNPGDYPIDNGGISIVEAVGKAGGFTRIAAPQRTKVIRTTQKGRRVMQINMDKLTDGSAQERALGIEPHDIIIVPESYF